MAETQIRAARLASGLSLREVARRAFLNPGYLSQIERGDRRPSRDLLRRLSDVLDVDLSPTAPPSEPVAARLSREALTSPGTVLAAQRRLEDTIGAAPLIVPTGAQLRHVTNMIIDARGRLRREALAVGQQWAQFAAWLRIATGDYPDAERCLDRASDWALEIDDPNMISTVLNLRGYVAWKLGRYGAMLSLSEAAQRDRRATPGLMAIACQQEARAHALLGDAEATDRKLDHAIECAQAADPRAEPPWVYFYGVDYLRLQRGRAYRYLGRRTKAAELLSAGLDALPVEMRGSEWAQSYVNDLEAVQ
jgi:transcriptional regulator with XRE-family HTH domain